MSQPDFRQDKTYRRGLILGLTMAEVMILLIFVLLMALAAALANREERIVALDQGGASRLVEALQHAYPQAHSGDDYFKELVRAIDARRTIESSAPEEARQTLLADAEIGRQAREAAGAAGVRNPEEARRNLLTDAETGRRAREAAQAAGARDPAAFARAAVDRMTRAGGSRRGEWPPFFSLSEAGGYYFDSGKATLRPEFERNLRETIIPLLARNIADYDVNVVEVIGHTDEVPMVGTTNLDRTLIDGSANRLPIGALSSADNAGLAIARAVAVVHVLRADPRLAGVTILPLSGAQMIVPTDRVADGTATGDDQTRRRIEIRLRRSSEQQTATIVRPARLPDR
jgi:flagellar motor protein MotB